MIRKTIRCAFVLGMLSLLLQPLAASAQFRAFINLGMSGSSFRGGNLEDASPIYRFGGGGGIRYIYASGFEFETGLNYTVKGAELEGTINEIPIVGVSEITYIELPVLIGYRFNTEGTLSPRLFAGPSMAFKTDAQIKFRAPGSEFEQTETDDTVEDKDLGLAVGIDVDTKFRGETLSFGLRSVFGFSNARSSKPELYNTTLTLHFGIVF